MTPEVIQAFIESGKPVRITLEGPRAWLGGQWLLHKIAQDRVLGYCVGSVGTFAWIDMPEITSISSAGDAADGGVR